MADKKDKKEDINLEVSPERKEIEAEIRKEIEAEIRKEMEEKADGVSEARYTENDLAKMEKSTKQILSDEEKVSIFIPEDLINNNPIATVSINGVTYAIPRGKEFLVPKSIKTIWDESYSQTIRVTRRIKIENIQNNEVNIID